MMATLNRMRHLAPPLGAGEEDQTFPNMVFVPIRVKHPVVPAREFTMYLLLLASFMVSPRSRGGRLLTAPLPDTPHGGACRGCSGD